MLLTFLAAVTIGIVRARDLISVVVLLAIYSFLMASVMIVLDAVDVAMTEAAVGAGVSTVLMLGTLYLTKIQEARPIHSVALPLFVAAATAAILFWATAEMPPFGSPAGPVLTAGPDYLDRSVRETGIPNVVTAVLASYRGFDTLGEVVVIFTAGIGALVLLKRPSQAKRDNDVEV